MAELEKAFLLPERGDKIPCLFNPETIAVGRSNNWSSEPRPGRSVSTLRYTGANSGWMSMDLVFDTTDTGTAVTTYTGPIMKLLEPDPDLPSSDEASNNVRPPTVTFNWGELHSFPAVVTNVSVRFTYFASTGVPLRAEMHLELRQYEASSAFLQNPTSGTPEPHRVHRVQPGETLDRISAAYYGDATRWRELAAANAVEDPLSVRPGTILSIPRATGS